MESVCHFIGRGSRVIPGIAGIAILVGALPAFADGVFPGITFGTRFDRPVPGAGGEGGEWIGSLTPQILLERLGPYTNWDFRAHRRYDSLQGVSGLRWSHDVVRGRLDSKPSDRTSLDVRGAYYGSRDVFNPDPEGQLAAADVSRSAGEVGLEIGRADAGYRIEDTRYASGTLADARSQAWSAALVPMRSQVTTWQVGWRREEWTVDGRTELTSSAATTGVRRRHTPMVASELELGVARISDDARGPARNEIAGRAGLTGVGHMLGLPFDARFEVMHEVTTTGLAEIWRPMAGARVGLKWERTLRAGGGVFEEAEVRDFVTFEARDTLAGRTILSLDGSYRRARPRSLAASRIQTYRAAAAISRDLRTWLRARVRYSYARQEAAAGISTADFERNRVEFELSAVYQ